MSQPVLPELLNAIRDHYVDFLRSGLRKERTRLAQTPKPSGFAVGLQLAVGDGSNPHKSRFNLPFRVDLLMGTTTAPQILKFEHDKRVDFQRLDADFPEGFSVTIDPFSWDSCDVLADGDPEDWRLPLEWFERWFDRDDQEPEDPDGIAQVIHEMTEPLSTADGIAFTIDFGAAPIDAFADLMRTLHLKGMRRIRVGTFFER